MSYIFLTKNNSENHFTEYFAIPDSKIESLNVSDTYNHYGQKIGHTDAGDYHPSNEYSAACSDLEQAICEKFNLEDCSIDGKNMVVETINGENCDEFENFVDVEDCENQEEAERHNEMLKLIVSIQEFAEEWTKENQQLETCKGFDYYDGHNWKTVITQIENSEHTHNLVTDESLIAELNSAIENKNFHAKGFGVEVSTHENWVIIDSNFQGTWESYSIIDRDDYEYLAENSSALPALN